MVWFIVVSATFNNISVISSLFALNSSWVQVLWWCLLLSILVYI